MRLLSYCWNLLVQLAEAIIVLLFHAVRSIFRGLRDLGRIVLSAFVNPNRAVRWFFVEDQSDLKDLERKSRSQTVFITRFFYLAITIVYVYGGVEFYQYLKDREIPQLGTFEMPASFVDNGFNSEMVVSSIIGDLEAIQGIIDGKKTSQLYPISEPLNKEEREFIIQIQGFGLVMSKVFEVIDRVVFGYTRPLITGEFVYNNNELYCTVNIANSTRRTFSERIYGNDIREGINQISKSVSLHILETFAPISAIRFMNRTGRYESAQSLCERYAQSEDEDEYQMKFERVKSLDGLGQSNRSIEMAQAIISKHSSADDVKLWLTYTHLRNSNYEQAKETLKAIKKKTTHYHLAKATIHHAEGDVDKALKILEGIRKWDNKEDEVQYILTKATLLFEKARYSDMAKALRQAREYSPKSVGSWLAYTSLGSSYYDPYGNFLDTIRSRHGNLIRQVAPLALKFSQGFNDTWQSDSATYYAKLALRLDPTLVEAEIELARSYSIKGHLDSALVCINRYSREHPDQYVTHYMFGDVYGHAGLYDKAFSHWRMALELDYFDSRSFYELGGIAELRQELQAAISYYNQAIWLDNNYFFAKYMRARCVGNLGSEEESIVMLRQLAAEYPTDHVTREQLALRLASRGQFQDAVKVCHQLIKLYPNTTAFWIKLAFLDNLLFDPDDFQSKYDEAVALDPMAQSAINPALNLSLGLKYCYLGKLTEAAAHFQNIRANENYADLSDLMMNVTLVLKGDLERGTNGMMRVMIKQGNKKEFERIYDMMINQGFAFENGAFNESPLTPLQRSTLLNGMIITAFSQPDLVR